MNLRKDHYRTIRAQSRRTPGVRSRLVLQSRLLYLEKCETVSRAALAASSCWLFSDRITNFASFNAARCGSSSADQTRGDLCLNRSPRYSDGQANPLPGLCRLFKRGFDWSAVAKSSCHFSIALKPTRKSNLEGGSVD